MLRPQGSQVASLSVTFAAIVGGEFDGWGRHSVVPSDWEFEYKDGKYVGHVRTNNVE